MATREEKKEQTRLALMDAALELVAEGENFSRISLREVAKKAGVVPTSFYRHFRDMEELGLCLVDRLGLLLRQMMRTARQQKGYIHTVTIHSLEVYARFVVTHRSYFYFLCQCRTGATPAIRQAIRSELSYFSNELASDIRQFGVLEAVNPEDLMTVCEIIVATVAETTIDLLDRAEHYPAYQQEYVEQLRKRLRLIWMGASMWRSIPESGDQEDGDLEDFKAATGSDV